MIRASLIKIEWPQSSNRIRRRVTQKTRISNKKCVILLVSMRTSSVPPRRNILKKSLACMAMTKRRAKEKSKISKKWSKIIRMNYKNYERSSNKRRKLIVTRCNRWLKTIRKDWKIWKKDTSKLRLRSSNCMRKRVNNWLKSMRVMRKSSLWWKRNRELRKTQQF